MSRVVIMPINLDLSLPVSAMDHVSVGTSKAIRIKIYGSGLSDRNLLESPLQVHAADERKFKRVKWFEHHCRGKKHLAGRHTCHGKSSKPPSFSQLFGLSNSGFG